jgi:hypothetical protein
MESWSNILLALVIESSRLLKSSLLPYDRCL